MAAEGAGYNPYRKANGEFASKAELGSVEEKVSTDLNEARRAGDRGAAAEIEDYAMDRIPESPLGKKLLEERYGSAATAQRPKAQDTPALYEELRTVASEPNSTGPIGGNDARRKVGRQLESVPSDQLSELGIRAREQLNNGRAGMAWDRSVSEAVATEQLRRTHEDTFRALEEQGYEHDGLGTYRKASDEKAPQFFVAGRGAHEGSLIARGNGSTGPVSPDEAIDRAAGAKVEAPKLLTMAQVKDKLRGAGVQYPANWSEMGSSSKDLWEERQYRQLQKREAGAAAAASSPSAKAPGKPAKRKTPAAPRTKRPPKPQLLQDSHENSGDEPIEIMVPAGERVRVYDSNGRDSYEHSGGEHGDSVDLLPGQRLSAI